MTIPLDSWQMTMTTTKFSACTYNILWESTVEIEVMVTSHLEVVRELHVRCTYSSKVLMRFVFITDELNVPWDLVSAQLSAGMIHLWLQLVPYSSYRHLQSVRQGDQLHLFHRGFNVIP